MKFTNFGLVLALSVGASVTANAANNPISCLSNTLSNILNNPLALLSTYPIQINSNATPGYKIPLDFVGVSMEVAQTVQPIPLGSDKDLLSILSVLGPNGVLRIGGITSDKIEPPLDRLTSAASFVKSLGSGWSMIYGVSCALDDPYGANPPAGGAKATGVAQEINTLFNSMNPAKIIFQIGNEPNIYSGDTTDTAATNSPGGLCAGSYSNYLTQWNSIYNAVINGSTAYPKVPATPNALFSGSDSAAGSLFNQDTYLPQFAEDKIQVPYAGHVKELTTHMYGESATGNVAIDIPELWTNYNMPLTIASITQNESIKNSGLPLRLTETGSINADSTGIEAATLGASVYDIWEMIVLAQNGWLGANFHMGDGGGYSPISASSSTPPQYQALPTLYAMYMFEPMTGGKILPIDFSTLPPTAPALAVLGADGLVRILIVNMSFNAITVPIVSNTNYSNLSVLKYTGESYDSPSVNINGATINSNGTWSTGTKEPSPTVITNLTGCGASVNISGPGAVLVTLNP